MEKPADLWDLALDLAEFTPAEVERITTLSTTMQRDWRQRGFIPRFERHARFDPFAVADIWAMKMLADRGIGPAVSRPIIHRAGAAIVYSALRAEGRDLSIVGDVVRTFDDLPLEEMPLSDAEQRRKDYYEKMTVAEPESAADWRRFEADWLERRKRPWVVDDKWDWIVDRICRQNGRPPLQAREITWWPTGEVEIDGYSRASEDKIDREDRFAGVALVLPIAELGFLFAKRAGKPLVVLK
jgi:hypothetical protein